MKMMSPHGANELAPSGHASSENKKPTLSTTITNASPTGRTVPKGLSGSCLCGSVSWELEEETMMGQITVCHCKIVSFILAKSFYFSGNDVVLTLF
jgi:hypothetical protein